VRDAAGGQSPGAERSIDRPFGDRSHTQMIQVHLQLHSHFTGSYNCAYNLSEIHDAFPVRAICFDLVVRVGDYFSQPQLYIRAHTGVLQGAAQLPWRGGAHDVVGHSQTGTCLILSYPSTRIQKQDQLLLLLLIHTHKPHTSAKYTHGNTGLPGLASALQRPPLRHLRLPHAQGRDNALRGAVRADGGAAAQGSPGLPRYNHITDEVQRCV
jgi:hypothetical protein